MLYYPKPKPNPNPKLISKTLSTQTQNLIPTRADGQKPISKPKPKLNTPKTGNHGRGYALQTPRPVFPERAGPPMGLVAT